MKYRHSFHAGNFADVHKHVTLLALLGALQRKDGGFLYLETHAGRGVYELGRANAAESAAAPRLLKELQSAQLSSAELEHYVTELKRLRARLAKPAAYPGSPLFAAEQLRIQDRAVFFEIIPGEGRALARNLRGFAHARVEDGDGFAGLRAFLPPRERRCLVLIDPPYEERSDFESVARACQEALQRLPSTLIAAWYPIKDGRTTDAWLARLGAALGCDNTVAEWWLYPRDSRVALNGSGMLILNPPYEFAARMTVWLSELQALFATPGSGAQVRRLAR
jgi:23S rRNA (adenine2030-N6)-methyltransferase